MRIKNILILNIFLSGFLTNSYCQKANIPQNEQQFINTCKKIGQALISKDLKTLNSYVNKNTGAYVLYGLGAYGGCLHLTKIVSDTSLFSLNEYYDSIPFKTDRLKFENKPIYFTCSGDDENKSYQWNKEGSFIDISNKHKPISHLMHFWSQSDLGFELSTSEKIRIKNIEKNMRKVVCTAADTIFYMSFINNKWYLTIIDQLETDCDA